MVDTTRLQLPLIAAAQAQKHVTHNEAVMRLDGLVQMNAQSYTTSAQPGSPADGDLYLLPAGKTGTNWGGYANHAVAHYYDGVWHQYAPRAGWISFVADTGRLVVYNGASWADVLTPSGASAADGSVSAPGFAFAADTNTGLYRIGADNPALSAGGSKLVDWKAAGNTQPLQPCFHARLTGALANKTGDGTAYTILFDSERWDQGANHDASTGVFTAPVTGRYLLGAMVELADMASDTFEYASADIMTSNTTHYGGFLNATNVPDPTFHVVKFAFSTVADMDAGDTASIRIAVATGTKTVDIGDTSYWYGALLC